MEDKVCPGQRKSHGFLCDFVVLQDDSVIFLLLADDDMSGNVICVCVCLQGNRVEMAMWLPKKTQLLGWAESLKRSSIELPDDFEERMTALRVKWDHLEVRPYTINLFSALCLIL